MNTIYVYTEPFDEYLIGRALTDTGITVVNNTITDVETFRHDAMEPCQLYQQHYPGQGYALVWVGEGTSPELEALLDELAEVE